MAILILTLPLPTDTDAAPEYAFVRSDDGRQVTAHGTAGAALLPAYQARTTELVAVLPAQALSWHALAVPAKVRAQLLGGRLEPARQRAILAGLLEEHLLDDPQALHLAVFAGSAAVADPALDAEAPPDTVWVAACERAWLRAHVQALEAAGHRVERLVPGCAPLTEPGLQVFAAADGHDGQWVFASPAGAGSLPLGRAAWDYLCGLGGRAAPEGPAVALRAEPALIERVEQCTGLVAQPCPQAQHLLDVARGPWDLAQGEFGAAPGGRWRQRLRAGWQQLAQAPHWRPVRWGLALLLLVQVVMLNALAWRTQSQLVQRRAALEGILTQTFPEVQVVLDAPVQMQRAVRQLALGRGLAGPDVGAVLTQVAAVSGTEISAIDLADGALQLQTGALADSDVARLLEGLRSRGWTARWQDGSLSVQLPEGL